MLSKYKLPAPIVQTFPSMSRIFLSFIFVKIQFKSENPFPGDEIELNTASISPDFINGKRHSGLGPKKIPLKETISDLSSSRHGSLYTSSAGGAGAAPGSNLASSFNSGLNTVGLNNGQKKLNIYMFQAQPSKIYLQLLS